jgi:GMP synthase-like glutamine amidotransferase
MKYLKTFENYKIPIYLQKIKYLTPKEIEVITSTGHFTLKLCDLNVIGNTNWLSMVYHHNTFGDTDDSTSDGEPDYLSFDIRFTKTDVGMNILCDITYGDSMVSEFKIDPYGLVTVIHYNGVGSQSDPGSHFALVDKSLEEFIKFLNRFSNKYELSKDDFTFLDNNKDSYKFPNKGKSMPIISSIRLEPLSENEVILVVDNSKTQDGAYAANIRNYLEMRGIDFINCHDENDFKSIGNKKVLGVISTGSNLGVNDSESNSKIDLNKKTLNFNVPFLGICFGFQTLSKIFGSKVSTGNKLVFDKILIDEWDKDSLIFKNINLDKLKVSFDYQDIVLNCPYGFKVIAKLDNKISGIEKDNKIFGLLFHPEDIASTQVIIDNFIEICKGGKNHRDIVFSGKFEQKKLL